MAYRPIKRLEDPKLITGSDHYVNDVRLPGALTVAFVRSPHAHALIRGIDTRAARAVPGVVAILTGPDIRHVVTIPSFDPQYFNNLWTEKGNMG